MLKMLNFKTNNAVYKSTMSYHVAQEHLKAAEYKMACANLAHDYREAVAYNLRRHKVEGSKHVAQAAFQKIHIIHKYKYYLFNIHNVVSKRI